MPEVASTVCASSPAHRYEEGKLPNARVESDTFAFRHVPYSKPSIQVGQRAAQGARSLLQRSVGDWVLLCGSCSQSGATPRGLRITLCSSLFFFCAVQNDLITLPTNMVDAHLMKLSISFALAQSTKLSVLEVRRECGRRSTAQPGCALLPSDRVCS